MGEPLASLIVLVLLCGLLLFMLTGARSGRRGQRDLLGRLGTPDGNFGVFLLGALAIAQLIGAAGNPRALSLGTGAIVGIILGLFVNFGPTRPVLSVIGFVAGLVAAYRLVTSQSVPPPTGMNALDSGIFRVALMLLVVMCFALGAGLGQMLGRGPSMFRIGGERGLAFFALIDFVTFAAAPAGAELLSLEPDRFYVYLAIGAAGAALIGLATSPFVLWALGAVLALTAIGLPLTGVSTDPLAVPTASFAVAASVAYLVVRALIGRLPGF